VARIPATDSGNDSHNHHDNFNDNFINNDNKNDNNNNNNYHDDTDRLETLPSPHMQTLSLLQIPCSIQLSATERQTPIHTYVDTGAQVSVLSVQAAGRAGVLQMMDRRHAGHAQGVGKCRVLGRLPREPSCCIYMDKSLWKHQLSPFWNIPMMESTYC
jgi:hypothetical protein